VSRNRLILLAVAGSAALLLGAWGSQMLAGLNPCELCIWQRWPHGAAVLIGAWAMLLPGGLLPLAGSLATAGSGAIGIYQTGLERDWWEGITACTSGPIDGLSTDDLLAQIMAAPVVHCDEVQWAFLGLSMASWNAVISFGLALIWLQAARFPARG
jgi:disulfide bond formation protein DsbB